MVGVFSAWLPHYKDIDFNHLKCAIVQETPTDDSGQWEVWKADIFWRAFYLLKFCHVNTDLAKN